MPDHIDNPNWRALRPLKDLEARKALRKLKPPPLSKKVSGQIRAPKDRRGKREGSDDN